MIVSCEECGKRYRIDAGKIKGKQARFNCKDCGHVITVTKPPEEPSAAPAADMEATLPFPSKPGPEAEGAQEPPQEEAEAPKKKEKKSKGRKVSLPTRFGLRSKMILLFFLVPILCIAAAGWIYIQQINNLSGLITGRSANVVNRMAEDLIDMKAKTVAKQVDIYLNARPGLPETRFNSHPEFKDIAVQKVGTTGYTALYERPGSDGVWRTWAHVNEKIIGIDMKDLREPLGKSFPGFWKVYTGVKENKASRGYYTWKDKDGAFRDKFMVCTPVQGTPYVIAATTYLYEFTNPIQELRTKTAEGTQATRNTILAILGATIVLIGLIVSLFGHRLTGRIQSLTDVADRISVGELEASVDVQSKDEIGDLADAVSRMQDSIRLSIERLRRKR